MARNIPVRRLDQHSSLVQLGYGRRRRLIQAAFTDGTSGVGADIACDKSLTKQLLRSAFVPVPAGAEVRSFDEAVEEWRHMGECAVVKPVDGHHGNGVTTEVTSIEALRAAFETASTFGSHGADRRAVRRATTTACWWSAGRWWPPACAARPR